MSTPGDDARALQLEVSIRRGEPMIWLTGSALGICILMIAGLVVVILVNGLSFFWPKPLEQVTLKDGSVFLGEVTSREAIPDPGQPDHLQKHRIQLRVGNRDLYGFDFKWMNEDEIAKREAPADAYFVERREYGALLGIPVEVKEGERAVAADPRPPRGPPRAHREGRARPRGDRDDREARDRRHQLPHREGPPRVAPAGPPRAGEPGRDLSRERAAVEKTTAEQQAQFEARTEEQLAALMEKAGTTYVTFRTAEGGSKELRSLDIYRAYPANELGGPGRLGRLRPAGCGSS